MKKTFYNYFTTGELAQLCKIPRKTLLYYDSLGLITPEVIDENGYRYYKRTQLFALELILTLRKLNLPLSEIKTYLADKSYENYKNILCDREAILEEQIRKMIAIKQDLHKSILVLHQLPNIQFNEILSVPNEEEFLCISNFIDPKLNFKDRTKISADLFIDLAKRIPLHNHTFGYIVDKNVLSNPKKHKYIKNYFYQIFNRLNRFNFVVKPKGIYLTTYFSGLYMNKHDKHINLLSEYCSQHKITPLSDLYITSVKNFWLTDNINEYIYKIEVQIK